MFHRYALALRHLRRRGSSEEVWEHEDSGSSKRPPYLQQTARSLIRISTPFLRQSPRCSSRGRRYGVVPSGVLGEVLAACSATLSPDRKCQPTFALPSIPYGQYSPCYANRGGGHSARRIPERGNPCRRGTWGGTPRWGRCHRRC
ncbi:hypothetical protein C8Q77DRAFT_169890 [Trametes polyzona]|nr:hypothetical protein C8Q77DRAFT_169890 [Trametes polyzona]